MSDETPIRTYVKIGLLSPYQLQSPGSAPGEVPEVRNPRECDPLRVVDVSPREVLRCAPLWVLER